MANRKVAGAVRLALIAASAAGITAYSAGTFAQDPELEQVVVTGSRIARAELDSEAPLSIVSAADIAKTGLNNVGDILQNLSSTDGTGLRPITTQTNGSDGANNISLRNLGAERTLILVDGRRWVTDGSGIVDLNTIPTSMIERIEVLKDGASAIYGSDAIAGVINIITKKKFEGLQLDVYGGVTNRGDGKQENYGVTMGANGERSNGVLSIDYSSQDAIYAKDRKISKNPYFGCLNPSDPRVTDYSDWAGLCGSTSTPEGRFTGVYPSDPYFGSYAAHIPGTPGTSPSDFRPFRSQDRFNFSPQNYLQQPIERTNIFGSGTALITDSIEAYAKAVYTKIQSEQNLASVPITAAMSGANGPQWKIPITADQYFNPFDRQINTWNWRTVALGPRNPTYDYDVYGINLGVKGDFELANHKYRWDVGLQYNDGQYDKVGKNYVNLFNLKNAMGPSFRDAQGVLRCGTPSAIIQGCVPLNVFSGPDLGVGAGVITAAERQAMLNYIGYTQVATSGNTTTDWYGDISGDLFDLPAGAVGIAIGTEFRKDEYFNQPDTLVASGGSSDNFSEATRGQRTVLEYYAELNIPVLKDIFLAKELTVNVANRWSDYSTSGVVGLNHVTSDPGNPSTFKANLTWRPMESLLIRGGWGETFRAPSVYDLYAGKGESYPSVQDPCNTGQFGTLSPAGQALCMSNTPYGHVPAGGWVQPTSQLRELRGGNYLLKPEQGENWTAGFVWEPEFLDRASLTMDYWNIYLQDAIQVFGASTTLSNCYRRLDTAFCDRIERTATGEAASINTTNWNAQERKTDGIDMNVRYAFDTERFGKFAFSWDTTYVMSDKYKASENSSWSEAVGQYDGVVHWEWRSVLNTTWTLNDLSATWTMRYTSALADDCWVGSPDYGYGYTKKNDGVHPMLCSKPNAKMPKDVMDFWGYKVGVGGFTGYGYNQIDARLYHDLQVAYNLPWNGTLSVGGRNILGTEPPKVNNSFAHSFDGAYDLPGGPYWYAQYKQKF